MRRDEKELLLTDLYKAVFQNRRKDRAGQRLIAKRNGDEKLVEDINREKAVAFGQGMYIHKFIHDSYMLRYEDDSLDAKEMRAAVNHITQIAASDAQKRQCEPKSEREIKWEVRSIGLDDDMTQES